MFGFVAVENTLLTEDDKNNELLKRDVKLFAAEFFGLFFSSQEDKNITEFLHSDATVQLDAFYTYAIDGSADFLPANIARALAREKNKELKDAVVNGLRELFIPLYNKIETIAEVENLGPLDREKCVGSYISQAAAKVNIIFSEMIKNDPENERSYLLGAYFYQSLLKLTAERYLEDKRGQTEPHASHLEKIKPFIAGSRAQAFIEQAIQSLNTRDKEFQDQLIMLYSIDHTKFEDLELDFKGQCDFAFIIKPRDSTELPLLIIVDAKSDASAQPNVRHAEMERRHIAYAERIFREYKKSTGHQGNEFEIQKIIATVSTHENNMSFLGVPHPNNPNLSYQSFADLIVTHIDENSGPDKRKNVYIK